MREQLSSYVNLLFAGTTDTEDIKQEILQNTLDRYDDLVAQGKAPEAAYRLAISGIGDIHEILGEPADVQSTTAPTVPQVQNTEGISKSGRRVLQAVAIGLYILCPLPLFIQQNEEGLCGLLAFVAFATILMVLAGKNKDEQPAGSQNTYSPQNETRKMIRGILWGCCIPLYVVLSMNTGAWYITWIIFPLCACIQGLIMAIMDLKED